MMDIQILIGMPLWYAKSVLEGKNISYDITETVSRSRFFACDEHEVYVVRATMEQDRAVLLTNRNMVMSDSVRLAIDQLEGRI